MTTDKTGYNVADDSQTSQWSVAAKVVASLFITAHLFTVFAAPWGNPPPSSGLSQNVSRFVHPYTQTLAIDNGYRYFAPDPEASHIIRYTLKSDDGTTNNGELPDRSVHWPRLLYHRHLMLSETTFQLINAAPDLPADFQMSEDEKKDYEWQRERARRLLRSLADQLLESNPSASSVELVLHEHAIPTPPQVINGLELTDKSLYDAGVNLGVFERESP